MCTPPALEPKPVVCAQSPVPPARWLTILRHRRCPNQRLFTVHTRARTARCRRPAWRRYPLRRPLPTRRRRPEQHRRARRRRSLSHPPTAARTRSERAGGPQTRMLAHTHTHCRGCALSFQADLQARHDGRGPGSVPAGNRDRQGLCSSESSPSLPAGCTAPAGGEPES